MSTSTWVDIQLPKNLPKRLPISPEERQRRLMAKAVSRNKTIEELERIKKLQEQREFFKSRSAAKHARLKVMYSGLKAHKTPGEPAPLTFREFQAIFVDAMPCCGYCHRSLLWEDMSLDHVIPLSRGGAIFDPANFKLSCRSCNYLKSVLTGHEFEVLTKGNLEEFYRVFPVEGLKRPRWYIEAPEAMRTKAKDYDPEMLSRITSHFEVEEDLLGA